MDYSTLTFLYEGRTLFWINHLVAEYRSSGLLEIVVKFGDESFKVFITIIIIITIITFYIYLFIL